MPLLEEALGLGFRYSPILSNLCLTPWCAIASGCQACTGWLQVGKARKAGVQVHEPQA